MVLVKFVFVIIYLNQCQSQLNEYYKQTPSGYIHQDCIHQFDEEFTITKDGIIVNQAGDLIGYDEPCPHKPILVQNEKLHDQAFQLYYSGWVSYADYLHSQPITEMSAYWTVPPIPPRFFFLTRALFFFNGLQDKGHGGNLILQPVLQYGSSGCGGGRYWSFISFLVLNSGRAYCGKRLRVQTGDVLYGQMIKNSDNSWTINSTDITTKETSLYTANNIDYDLKYATICMEGNVIYNCQDYPANDKTTFSDILVRDQSSVITPQWVNNVHYTECNQGLDISQDGKVINILYNSTIKNK